MAAKKDATKKADGGTARGGYRDALDAQRGKEAKGKPGIGHNSGKKGKAAPAGPQRRADGRLQAYVARIQRLQEEKAALVEDIKQVFQEAKSAGYDTKIMRKVMREMDRKQEERDEEEALLDIYRGALGLLGDTPLGEAAVRRIERERHERAERDRRASQNTDEPDKPADAADPGALQGDLPDPAMGAAAGQADDPFPGVTVADARAQGFEAAQQRHSILSNPFPARDPRRAAFDEGWCQASDSDGMDLPASWRRAKPAAGGPAGANKDARQ